MQMLERQIGEFTQGRSSVEYKIMGVKGIEYPFKVKTLTMSQTKLDRVEHKDRKGLIFILKV